VPFKATSYIPKEADWWFMTKHGPTQSEWTCTQQASN